MFRVIVRTRLVNGETHYHVRVNVFRDGEWCVCGVASLHENEWLEAQRFFQLARIEVSYETLPVATV